MDSIKIENGHSAISGSSVKLRTKFIKHFPSLQIQQNVIQTIENLNSSSILDIFKFLYHSTPLSLHQNSGNSKKITSFSFATPVYILSEYCPTEQ